MCSIFSGSVVFYDLCLMNHRMSLEENETGDSNSR